MDLDSLTSILLIDKPSEFIRINEEQIFDLIPELYICKNFNQNSIWHIYDVYEHILHVIDGVPNDLVLRMAALFHDIGKPLVYSEDEFGIGHFYDHWNKSNEIFLKFMSKYSFDEKSTKEISNLILYHDLNIDRISEENLLKLLTIFDEDGIVRLFQLKESDLLAQNKEFHYLLNQYGKQKEKMLSKIRRN